MTERDTEVVTFALNEPGTAYCRVTRSDSGEADLRSCVWSERAPREVKGCVFWVFGCS